MGQTLSVPATNKTSETGANDRFFFAISEMQGWRITMEDAHAAVLDLDGQGENSNAFFAVYDGHGGSTVAKFAGQNVHKRLVSEESYKQGNYEAALKRAFLGTDEDLLANPAHTRDPSGCTAVAALLTRDNKIYVANAGDSRSVLAVKGDAEPMSWDHKPTNALERARITSAGGYVEYGRVNGNLALSRALGDFEFKKNYSVPPESQVITANPDVICHEITEEDEFLVLACDGIWDCLSSQQVIDFIRYQVSEGKELTEICGMIFDHCIAPDTSSGAGIGCDNMTLMIVAITHGRTKEEWYKWISDRVKNGYGRRTSSTPPQLYSQSRVLSFRAREEARRAREREREQRGDTEPDGLFDDDNFLRKYGLTVTTISSNGISYRPRPGPEGSTFTQSGGLMFSPNENEEDDSEEEPTGGPSVFTESLGLGSEESPDPTKNLRARLNEFEQDIRKDNGETDADGDANMQVPESEQDSQSQPTTKLPNGDTKGSPEVRSPTPLGEPMKA